MPRPRPEPLAAALGVPRERRTGLLAEANPRRGLCLHGVPGGEPQTVASFDCETQNPSGPRQPGPPLQPQPLQRQASSANAVDGPVNDKNAKEISKNAPAMRARMLHLPL